MNGKREDKIVPRPPIHGRHNSYPDNKVRNNNSETKNKSWTRTVYDEDTTK